MRALAFCGALLMSASLWPSPRAYADEKDDKKAAYQQTISQYQQQIDQKKKELEEANKKLADAKKNTSNTKSQLNAMQNRNAILQGEINLIDEQITTTEDAIAENKANEASQEELFHKQVRMEEEAGDISYWSVLFRATGMADLLARIDFVNEIMDYNSSVIENLRSIRADLEEQENQLKHQMDEKDAAQKVLAGQMEETTKVYNEYKKTQEGLQAEYDMIAAEEKDLEKTLAQVEKEAIALGVTGGSSGGYIWPIKVNPIYITSKFGYRPRPTAGASTLHNGIDIGVSYVPVYAAKAGTVTFVQATNTGYGFGRWITISHGQGYSTIYGHLNRVDVKVGDVVSQGQQIAQSGNAGTSTGPHLDFRIIEAGSYVKPLSYLSGYTLLC